MKEENLDVSRRMFKHACAFLDCASFCQIEPNAFEQWRYIYEKSEGSVHILFLRGFALSLRTLCCKEFYGESWDEFKGNRH